MTIKTLGKVTLLIAVLVLLVLAAGITWFAYRVQQHLTPPADPAGQPSVVHYLGSTDDYAGRPAPDLLGNFSWESIAHPPMAARAWTRWWWPGGDVDAVTIDGQLQLLDDAGFGGVEIQPFIGGMGAVYGQEDLMARVYQFDTPTYYEALTSGIQSASRRGLQVDLTHFSGWPPGGPELNLEDSTTIIAYSELDLDGGRDVSVALPPPRAGLSEYIFTPLEMAGADFTNFPADNARLLSVVAGRPVAGRRNAWFLSLDDTVTLDETSLQLLTDKVSNGILNWRVPDGQWKVVASYIMPSGEVPMGAAQKPQGFVLDHLRSAQVRGHYEYAYGARTNLPQHYGRGLRGFFNDSLEFRVKRMSVEDILTQFRKRRGYDLEPYLPAIYVEGIDNVYFKELLGVNALPEFAITAQDHRIRHDYQQTLSDLIIERFIENSANWAEQRGLVSRGQSYGMDIDLLRAMGANTIPETEQLWAGGSDVGLKFASSAAALYGRPLVSAEAFVWIQRDYVPTARRIKAAADKLFLAGINHIIYHGTPYPWTGGDSGLLGEEGWMPFSAASSPGNFSTNASPGNDALWHDIPALNAYIARTQYLLRQGAPEIDVLVYYPFLGFHGPNPQDMAGEALVSGSLPDADPAAPFLEDPTLTGARKLVQSLTGLPAHVDERVAWVEKLRPLLLAMDRKGISWGWVNGHALQSGNLSAGAMVASGGNYGAILVPDVDQIELDSLAALKSQIEAGVPVLFAGRQPVRQPGFHEAERGDAAVRLGVGGLLAVGAQALDFDEEAVIDALQEVALQHPVPEAGSAIKHHTRALADGSRIHFFANQSAEPSERALPPLQRDQAWWFDALEGTAWPVDAGDSGLKLSLRGFESRFLVEGVPIPGSVPIRPPPTVVLGGATEQEVLAGWGFTSGDFTADWQKLPDWREVSELRHARGGTYVRKVDIRAVAPGSRYFLDLGLVHGSASVVLNGVSVGRASIPPFTLDVTSALRSGENRIEIEVLAPLRNHFVGRALAGDPRYSQMQAYGDQLVAAGLVGPVVLSRVAPRSEDDRRESSE